MADLQIVGPLLEIPAMVNYDRSNVAIPSGLRWDEVTQLSVVSASSTVIRLQNTDGTITEVVGTGFTFDDSNSATAGTVTAVHRLSTDGTTMLESITRLNHSLVGLLANINAPGPFLLAANNWMEGGSLADDISGFDGNDILLGREGADALDGGAGIDAASYVFSTAGVTVDLATGVASGGDATGDTFTSIENLIGSAHADTLTGNTGNNALSGGAGNDTLIGGGGDDIVAGGAGGDALKGGAGLDTASYTASTAGVAIDLATGAASGGHAAGDTLAEIENLIGSGHADTLTGNARNNTLTGGAGGDALHGGAGFDTASYAGSTAAVMVNLLTGAASGGDAAGDTFTSIENLIGSAHADALTGNSGVNVLNGGRGNDTLAGGDGNDTLHGGDHEDTLTGGAGGDALHGGAGIDTTIYAGSTTGVTINLATGAASGGSATGDTFTGLENLVGSAHADTLTGNAGNNALTGGAGNDTLAGGGGNDTLAGGDGGDTVDGGAGNDSLIGGAGEDALHGGTGVDAASYAGSTAGVTVNLTTGAASGGHATGDTFTSIENLLGSAHGDTLTGSTGNNVLNGGAGSDRITGGAGDDSLAGAAGNDTLTGGAGGDALDGGAGIDVASYAGSAAGVTVNLATGAALGGHAAGDRFIGIENLIGSTHADTLTGNVGNNALFGGAGNDTLVAGDGNDKLFGGDGDDLLRGGAGGDALDGGAGFYDAASYAASTAGVTVNLATGAASGGHATGDTVTGIEDLIGSAHADTLTGDAGDNWLAGGAEGDTLYGGAGFDMLDGDAGNDTLLGGGGDDTLTGGPGGDALDGGAGFYDAASYAASTAGVTVNLATRAASGGHATGDTVTGIEDLIGSAHADTLTGDDGDNWLAGGAEGDTFTAVPASTCLMATQATTRFLAAMTTTP
jgi:Ca2+-binding RTX toxin-like protein